MRVGQMRGGIELPSYAQGEDHLSLHEEDGEAELAGLLPRSRLGVAPQHAAVGRRSYDNDRQSSSARKLYKLALSLLVLILAIFFAQRHFYNSDRGGSHIEFAPPVGHKPSKTAPIAPITSSAKGPMPIAGDASSYSCPEFNSGQHTQSHKPEIHQLAKRHNKTLVEYKKGGPLDGWGISYSKLKKLLRNWKEMVFVPNIRSGDIIYESACGVGINLLLTAEILQSHSITNLTVHGNDYSADTIRIANQLWNSFDASQVAKKGQFCQGDSSRLADFVPASSFDLAYTGYLVPLIDPLGVGVDMTEEENWEFSFALCNSTDPKDEKLREREQRTQEEWVCAWVKELVRIVKPGKVVGIENVAYPLCSNEGGRDWGGVSKAWWSTAITKYEWDVELDSLLISDEGSVKGWSEKRYHVMMRKKVHAKKPVAKPEVDESSSICPRIIDTSVNDKNADDFDLYVEDAIAHQNKKLKDFRSMKLDGWGLTFQEVKGLLRPWKTEVFAENIHSGDSIYESAMGIGMNLLISAEVLKEHNINNITVSGNDYVGESVAIANSVWDEEEAKQLAQKGFFCQADSTKLDFIPNESFDFVFTGYIDPITDPLDIWPSNMTAEEKWAEGVVLCNSTHKKDQRLAKHAQDVQNDWFASWVKELVRIAKPGKAIAIENGAESLCTNPEDWGGVDKSWWKEAINKYGFDVDSDSILIRDEKPTGNWLDTRYHVMMRKHGVPNYN